MATAKQGKSPSPAAPTSALAALSLDTPAPAVPDDELEAFRREWRAEVSKKREVEVDAGGVLWKGTEREGEEGKSKVVKEKGKGIVEEKGKSAEEVWPEPLRSPTSPRAMPTSPTKMVRPRSPVKIGTGTRDRARSDVKPPGPKSPTKAAFMASSPTKSTAPIASKRFPSSTPYTSPAAASRPAHPGPTSASIIARTDSPAPSESDSDTMPFPQRKRGGDAIALYTRAVEAEQAGKLSDALHLYRRAFRADDNVDRLYALNVRKADAERARLAPAPTTKVDGEGEVMTEGPSPADIVDPQAPELPEYKFTREVQVRPDYEREVGRVSRLTALLERRVGVIDNDEPKPISPSSKALDSEKQDPDPAASFRPSDPALPLPLSLLPAELLDRILSYLDVIGIERFASTCWRARLLTAQCGLWKRLAEKIYAPPMVPEASMAKVLARKHRDEWRTTLVEEERLRMDGAYIAVCHYVRPGAGEQWVTITHMSELRVGGRV